MTVEAIKEAIAALPENERHSLASWLNELDYDDWDRQSCTMSCRMIFAGALISNFYS